jgi:NADPH:quinone reductase-like Zn-dependent oxidoreductase
MKAAVYIRFGLPENVLQIQDVEKPVPKDDEVLIRVRAASVNPLDSHLMKGKPFFVRLLLGLHKPKRPGVDVAGEVEAVGRNVTEFKPGDEVFGSCKGAFAEYVCTAEKALAMKPENITFEQAAGVPVAAYTALQGLRDKGKIQAGQKILINGASGGVGTFAVQIGKWLGADVTCTCSTRNVDFVRSIGADRVIDYTQEDFTGSGQKYDLIFDLVGSRPFSVCRRVLNPRGIYIGAGILGAPDTGLFGMLAGVIEQFVSSWFVSQKTVMLLAKVNKKDLSILCELMRAGKVTPVIDKCYSLSEAPEAVRYLAQKHARGKVVISI